MAKDIQHIKLRSEVSNIYKLHNLYQGQITIQYNFEISQKSDQYKFHVYILSPFYSSPNYNQSVPQRIPVDRNE